LAKDFGPIESDYAFFMAHATEAEQDVAEYARELATFADGRATIRLLDFGCGTGEFSERLLTALNWPADLLHISLVEPVVPQCEEAARRLANFSRHAIARFERLPDAPGRRFDLVLSNHALYYVDDLDQKLRLLSDLLKPGGKMLLAIAGWDNTLMQIWKRGLAVLSRIGAPFRKSKVPYLLRFPDTLENRLRILRFLFGEFLPQISPERLLGEFDNHVCGGYVEVNTDSDHFTVFAQ
jgi:trans-aconitate 2-methyltransferase